MSDGAIELGEALDCYESATDFVNKARAAEALAETVRTYMEENEPSALSDSPRRTSFAPSSGSHSLSFSSGSYFASGTDTGTDKTAIKTGLNIWHNRTVTYDGETYPTAFNAFQAQKETAKDKRKRFTTCSWSEAAAMGRTCSIDVSAWDEGREELIADILFEQASQHQEFAMKIIKYAGKVVENSMGDKWWIDTMPRIWDEVKRMVVDHFPALAGDNDADEDDEVVEEDDDGKEEGHEEQEAVQPPKKLKRVAKALGGHGSQKVKKPKRAMA